MSVLRSSLPVWMVLFATLAPVACGSKADTQPVPGSGSTGGAPGTGSTGSGSTNTGGIQIGTGGGSAGAEENPCLGDNPPASCGLESPPGCGDGTVDLNADTCDPTAPPIPGECEFCDDGNPVPGDGCNGICKKEANYECPASGGPCVFVFVCGNGKLEPGEVCDDNNTVETDGCNATCTVQSASYVCPKEGEPCIKIYSCGDSKVQGAETCEDGNTVAGDGCDADCNKEPGWSCLLLNEPCTPAPHCGDGTVTPSRGETCDDGNASGNDGCTADCLNVESGYTCPTPGQPCQNLAVCGDGIVNGKEQCDDGANTVAGDGCYQCNVEEGYECPFPGAPCVAKCGDGIVLFEMEICDDGGTDHGCSDTCEWEDGFACTGTPPNYSCVPTVCGDGVRAGTESCDDGNTDMGDGCTPFCKVEPECPVSGACTSTCGDGLLLGSEACDDGNNRNNDGCSSDCQVEPGNECNQPTLGASIQVPVIYRDFLAGHPDFELGATGCEEAAIGMVASTLDADGKPTLVNGNVTSCAHVTSVDSFRQWYRDVGGTTNRTIPSTLTLYNNGSGGYVNRYGANGEQYLLYSQPSACWCGSATQPDHDAEGNAIPCTYCPYDSDPSTPQCEDPQETACSPGGNCADYLECVVEGGVYHGIRLLGAWDGNPVFFPVDSSTFTPAAERTAATVPPPYANWQAEPGGAKHNFHFTSEVRFWFKYDSSVDQILDFTGDDDVWVFINGRLAVDLGGIHIPVDGTVNVRTAAASLGLTNGNVYEIVVFQAERQTSGSSYKLTLSGFNAAASDCGPICGDAIVSPGEACDNGDALNNGEYGHCNADCTRGPYCGDGVQQAEEECDNGVNTSGYATTSEGACAPGCRLPAKCGDNLVQSEWGEECDGGENCLPDCTRGPYCGDAHQDAGEACDQGLNDASYNGCNPDCTQGPHCGDGQIAEGFETCDGGADCSPNCKPVGVCGDVIVQSGEDCDDGENDGGWGECGPNCKHGIGCGDGVTQPEYEECDDGLVVNGVRQGGDGSYGGCSKTCALGPHCGDNVLQSGYEECDDGNLVPRDYCSETCKNEIIVPR